MCCPNMGSDVTTRITEAPMKNRSIAARITKRVTECGPAFSDQSAAPPERSFAKRVTQPDDLCSSSPVEPLLKRVTETWKA